MTAAARPATGSFALRYGTALRPLMAALGMGPAHSAVDVSPDEIRVRMGWAFRAHIPLADVRHAEHGVRPRALGWGVHGWGGRWLVNASSEGIIRLDIDPPVRVVAVGLPVRLTTLWIGLADPDAFLSTVGAARAAGHG